MYEILLVSVLLLNPGVTRDAHHLSGGVPTGQPCTLKQQSLCLGICADQVQPGETLASASCEQTEWWGTPGGSGFDCHCKIKEPIASCPAPPRPRPQLEV